MYLLQSFLITILPFLAAAIPPVQPKAPQARGITIPISKRSFDPSKSQTMVQNSVVKIRKGMAAFERSTGKTHSLATGIKTIKSGKRSNGVIPLGNQNANLWFGKISVGTPPVNYNVEFDTGSSDLFLLSTSCDSSCGSGHNLYDPSASSTSQDLGKTFTLSYNDGSKTSGEQFSDVVTIVGLTAKSQVLGAAKIYDGSNSVEFAPDGRLGLAFESISEYGASPTLQTLQSEGVLANPIFGFYLGPSGTGSQLTVGGLDPKYNVDTDFTWLPITPGQGFWQASFDQLSLSGSNDSGPLVGSTLAIFDTGTSMIIGDPTGIAALYKALADFGAQSQPDLGDGMYSIPCDFNTAISFSLRGSTVEISPVTFNLGPISGSNRCIAGAAAEASLTGEFWILGDVFLQNVYTGWNFGNRNFGFAQLR